MFGRVVTSLALVGPLAACTFKPVTPIVPEPEVVATEVFEQVENNELDLLVVLDDSGSMAEEQFALMAQLAAFVEILEATGAVINVASVTTDANINPQGNFFTNPGNTVNSAGVLVRAIPQAFCDGVIANSEGGVLSTANQALLDFIDNFGQIEDFTGRANGVFVDANGDKRADNFVTATFADAFGCLAAVGIRGFGSEVGLCQAIAALDERSLATNNSAFLRNPDSILAIVFVGDEDDCNENFTINNTPEGEEVICSPVVLNSQSQSLRCSQSVNENICGTGDFGRFENLVDVSVFADRIKALRDDERLFIATVTGPPGVSISDCDERLPIPTCFNEATGSASPGNRFFEFANLFTNKLDALEIPQGICGDFGGTIAVIGEKLGALLNAGCLNVPIDAANFDIDRDLTVLIDITDNVDGITACNQILNNQGEVAAEVADPAEPNRCRIINNSTNLALRADDGCRGGFAIDFVNIVIPGGAQVFTSYVGIAQ